MKILLLLILISISFNFSLLAKNKTQKEIEPKYRMKIKGKRTPIITNKFSLIDDLIKYNNIDGKYSASIEADKVYRIEKQTGNKMLAGFAVGFYPSISYQYSSNISKRWGFWRYS